MRKGYKFRGGTNIFDEKGESRLERDIKTLVNNQIYAPLKENLNDPTETLFDDSDLIDFLNEEKKYSADVSKIYEDIKNSIVNKNGIYSLSNGYESELLWAYYSDGHHGFCIEYDIDKIINSLNYNRYANLINIVDIDYKPNIPIINRYNFNDIIRDSNKMLQAIIGTKSISWKHEDEVRLIFEKSGLIDIDYRAVTAIYFGYRMHQKYKDQIMIGLQGRNIKYFEMRFVANGYRLEAKQIIDAFKNTQKYISSDTEYDNRFLSKESMGEMYIHRESLEKALNKVRYEPLITEIFEAIVIGDIDNPEFKVFAYTKNEIAPVRPFVYRLKDLN